MPPTCASVGPTAPAGGRPHPRHRRSARAGPRAARARPDRAGRWWPPGTRGDVLGMRAAHRSAPPTWHLAEHPAVIDLLERLALDEVVAHLADEQHHRRGVLERRMHADRRIGRARSTSDECHARLPGQLGVGIGHEGRAGLVAIDDQADAARVVQRIEHGEVAFARNAEDVIDPWICSWSMRMRAALRIMVDTRGVRDGSLFASVGGHHRLRRGGRYRSWRYVSTRSGRRSPAPRTASRS